MRRLALWLALAVGAGCADETSIVLTFSFDCSVDPSAIQRVVVWFEPPGGGSLDALPPEEAETFEDDVRIRSHDVDADGTAEWELTLFANRFVIRDGMTLRIVADEDPGPLEMRAVAADAVGRQVAQGPDREGRPARVAFRPGEQLAVRFPITCVCLGLPGCAGACEHQPETCQADPFEGRYERLCGDEIWGPEDNAMDCADPECWDLPACTGCSNEACNDRYDNDCDSLVDCADDDCARFSACRTCTAEDCGDEDDFDPDHDDDEDCDDTVDCGDRDCWTVERCRCPGVVPLPEICDDVEDNDCDGLVDCADPDCDEPFPTEDCYNGFDDDCDGLADCAVPQCQQYCCQNGGVEDCSNGLDDNCDELVDCADPGCRNGPDDLEDSPQECFDFADNDCDDLEDCQDDKCTELGLREECSNGIDDDCDGLADCADLGDCGPELPPETACGNGLDDDCDGSADCHDMDCYQPETGNCGDGTDNDCNGRVDCSDESCLGDEGCEGCRPESCSNGVSDDCDGLVDCADLDCALEC